MAAMHEEEVPEPAECANCGATQSLLKCSRCHTVWFCGVQCQKSYWPFHKPQCKRNEFADLIEESEPKFARWMRRHGKLAVLKDDEVDRLERAGGAVSGASRQDVMESMYGRLEPKPKEATYSAEDRAAVRRRDEAAAAAARRAALAGAAYHAIELPANLGLECARYKWRQNQSHVEVFVPLPEGFRASKAQVQLRPGSISVVIDERPVLTGRLYREIKAEESTWFVQDGVLEISLLKRSRRGHYEGGTTNADTYWRAVVKGAAPHETLALEHPPTEYYWSLCDDVKAEAPRLPPAAARAKAEAAAAQRRLGAPATPTLALEA